MSRKTLGGRTRATAYGTAAVVLLSLASTATTASAAPGDPALTASAYSTDGKSFVLTGDNLAQAEVVMVGSTAVKLKKHSANADATTTIKFKTPSLKGGSYYVTVVTPDGNVTLKDGFGARPVVSKIVAQAKVNNKDVAVSRVSSLGSPATVRLLGTGFTGLKSVTFGKASVTSGITVVSDTVATVAIPKADAAEVFANDVAKVVVKAENKWGTSVKGGKLQYDALPTVTSVSRKASLFNSKAATNTVVLKGTNLANATLKFGTKSVKALAGATATEAKFQVPAVSAAGSAALVVGNKATVKAGKTAATEVSLFSWSFAATVPTDVEWTPAP